MPDASASQGGAAVIVQYNAQPMDCAMHPSVPVLAAALISGRLEMHCFDAATSSAAAAFSLKAHGESARAVRFSPDGSLVATASADQSILAVDAATGQAAARKAGAHATGVDRLMFVSETVLASGDDDGSIRLWDTRQADACGAFDAHTDYISDFAAHPREHALLASSGDGTLSVNDLRTFKVRARSEDDAEEEFLSLAVLKRGKKIVAGASDGVLNIFSSGYWNDCSDRYPGHPAPVDCMAAVDDDTVATGAADGIVRLISIQPHKMLGVLGCHGNGGGGAEEEGDPVHALAFSAALQLLASAGVDDTVRVWDLAAGSSSGSGEAEAEGVSSDLEASKPAGEEKAVVANGGGVLSTAAVACKDDSDKDSDSDGEPEQKRKRNASKGAHKIGKRRGGASSDSAFFADL